MASVQEDDISVTRDNDRHNYGDLMITIPGFPADATYQRAEFRPETSLVDTTTFEINLVSNEPAMNGKLDWTIGAFYMEHEIENHIVGYLDADRNGEIQYICGESYANSDYCYPLDSPLPWFFFEFDFVSDAYPTRESYSIYGETSYSLSDQVRFISGLRYIEDEVESCVKNFFTTVCDNLFGSSEETTGKVALEYDVDDDTMVYASFTSGSKPGGTNLTYGYTTQAELNAAFLFTSPLVDPLVFRTFEAEAVDSMEFGLKTDLYDGRARANIAIFSYDYENLQFQATDPDPYRGGVANIPESEMSGVEIEFTGLVSDQLTFDMNLAFLDSEVSSDYEALDNVTAYQYFWGEEDLRLGLRTNIKGNELAKTPEFTADVSLKYETVMSSGTLFTGILQYVKRGEFQQRVNNNPLVDAIDAYDILNLTASFDFVGDKWGLDLMILNASDEDGVNSSMTDVFGVAATGIELIPPRQIMARLSMNY